jgi:hypothetical protein
MLGTVRRMSNQKRTPEELERLRAEGERRTGQARDGLKSVELARKRLPENIYALACEACRFQLLFPWVDADLGTVIRLAVDQRMESVWKLFSLPRVDPHEAREFFRLALMAPYEWGQEKSVLDEKWRIEKIAHLCGSLGSLLEQAPFSVGERETNILKVAACAAYRRKYGKVLPLDHPSLIEIIETTAAVEESFMYGEKAVETVDRNQFTSFQDAVAPFLNDPHRGFNAPSQADCLRELRDYCYRELEAHRQRLPRKIAQSSARRTYVIRQVSKFTRQVLSQPYHEYVAATVVVVLDLPEDGSQCLDGDYVRKVTADL